MALIERLDDRTLVEQHRAGDDEAFRQIVERHHRSLYANALRRLGDPVLAEDAVQETFLRAFRNLDRFEGEYHLDAWLHRIVTNACHDIGRRRGRDTRLFDRACGTVEFESPAADDQVDVLPDHDLGLALGQLPEAYREAVVLRFVEELSYSDVAEKAGISEENARARVSRGRNMLKKMLSSTSALAVWAIPPLRRFQGQPVDADAASQAAQQVHNLTGITNAVSATASSGGVSQLSNLVAQAGPAIASAGPTVASTGPAVKAAVAAGLAAAVAIPTGVAVDRAREKAPTKPEATVVEEVPIAPIDEPVDASDLRSNTTTDPQATVPIKAAAAGPSTTTALAEPATSSTTVAPTDATTSTAQPSPSTSAPAPTDTSAPPPAEEAPAEEEPPPTSAPTGPATVRADGLAVSAEDPRLIVDGRVTLEIAGEVMTGNVSGRLHVGEAASKDDAPRRIQLSTLTFSLDDGTTLTLTVAGELMINEQGVHRTYNYRVGYSLEGGDELGLASGGEALQIAVVVKGDTGSLALTLPGRSS